MSKLVCSHLQLRHLMLLIQTEEPEVYPLSTAILEAEIPFWTNQIVCPSSVLPLYRHGPRCVFGIALNKPYSFRLSQEIFKLYKDTNKY